MTPLRQQLVQWCGFQYDQQKDRFFRPSGIINLRKYPRADGDQWQAFIAVAGQPETPLCIIESLGHLMRLVIDIEGDQNALQLQPS